MVQKKKLEMVEMYYAIENKKDREEYWTWETRFEDNNISKHTREPFELPKCNIKLHFKNEPSFTPEYWLIDDFELVDYQSHLTIKAPLYN